MISKADLPVFQIEAGGSRNITDPVFGREDGPKNDYTTTFPYNLWLKTRFFFPPDNSGWDGKIGVYGGFLWSPGFSSPTRDNEGNIKSLQAGLSIVHTIPYDLLLLVDLYWQHAWTTDKIFYAGDFGYADVDTNKAGGATAGIQYNLSKYFMVSIEGGVNVFKGEENIFGERSEMIAPFIGSGIVASF